jgi:hypothetical protein
VTLPLKNKYFRKSLVLLLIASFFLPITSYLAAWLLIVILLFTFEYSLGESLGLSVLIIFVSQIILYSFVTIFGLHMSVLLASRLPLILSILALIYAWPKVKKLSLKKRQLFSQGDLPAILIGVVTFIILLIPIAHLAGGDIAQFLSYGEDNASHYALTRYIYQHGAFAYNQHPTSDGLLQSLEIYPQGFHVNAAVFIGLAYPKHLTESGFIKVYAVFIAFSYALFIFWFTKICLGLAKGAGVLFRLSLMPAVFFLCGFGTFLLLLYRGFQPQVFAYEFLAAIVFLLSIKAKKNDNKLINCLVAISLIVGVASSWWLLLPMVCLLVLQYAWENKLFKQAYEHIWKILPVLLIIAFAILYPVLVNILLTKKQSPLDEPGGVDIINGKIFWYILPVVVLASPILIKKAKTYAYIYSSLVLTILGAFAIGIYQKKTVGQYEYYFYKSIYSILLICFALLFISVTELGRFLSAKVKGLSLLLPLIIVGLTVLFALQTRLVYYRVYIHNWFPSAVQTHDLEPLFNNSVNKYSDVIYIGSCSVGRNYLEDRWSGARLLSESLLHSQIELSSLFNLNTRLSKDVLKLADDHRPLMLVEYPDCINKIPNLTQIQKLPNVTVIKST